jgi:hypothetical protein
MEDIRYTLGYIYGESFNDYRTMRERPKPYRQWKRGEVTGERIGEFTGCDEEKALALVYMGPKPIRLKFGSTVGEELCEIGQFVIFRNDILEGMQINSNVCTEWEWNSSDINFEILTDPCETPLCFFYMTK